MTSCHISVSYLKQNILQLCWKLNPSYKISRHFIAWDFHNRKQKECLHKFVDRFKVISQETLKIKTFLFYCCTCHYNALRILQSESIFIIFLTTNKSTCYGVWEVRERTSRVVSGHGKGFIDHFVTLLVAVSLNDRYFTVFCLKTSRFLKLIWNPIYLNLSADTLSTDKVSS